MATLKSRAAVAFAANSPLTLCEVDVQPPKKGEVRIRIVATGMCHTDIYTLSGRDPEGLFPCILGHEGAGVVESVGEGVDSVRPGDEVIPLYTAECRVCKFCKSGKTNLCGSVRETQGKGLMPDGTTRFSYEGKPIFHFMGCSTFSEFTVVAAVSVAKVGKGAKPTRFNELCLLGCGVTTGMGAVQNTAKVEKGATVAVFGLGVIGLSVILACVRLAGASRVIGVDVDERKFVEYAQGWGCDEFVNPNNFKQADGKTNDLNKLRDEILRLTDGGVDYSFECVGNTDLMRCALEVCHKGWGTSVVIGVAGMGEEIRTRPFQLVTGRVWKGSAFGGVKGRSELQKFIDWSEMAGEKEPVIPLSRFITHKFQFEQISQAVQIMSHGAIGGNSPQPDSICLRPVMEFGPRR